MATVLSDYGPVLIISINLNYLNTLSPDPVTFGVRASAYEIF